MVTKDRQDGRKTLLEDVLELNDFNIYLAGMHEAEVASPIFGKFKLDSVRLGCSVDNMKLIVGIKWLLKV